jgi:short subunit dehydrogenase-like uncharacterized protein
VLPVLLVSFAQITYLKLILRFLLLLQEETKKSSKKLKAKTICLVPVVVADSFDRASLNAMCKQANVILSTAGPYHKYGSHLLSACVENDCHYVDITGESFWVKEQIEKHHDAAKAKSLRIINACGFDSVPSDLGVFFAVNSVKGRCSKR